MSGESLSPIFVVGTGRSGSTIFYKMLSMHPDVAWVNRILADYPKRLSLHRAYLRLIDTPIVGDWLLQNGLTPDEGYGYWDHAYRGFERPFRDLTAADVTERARIRFRQAVERITVPRRTRPLIKVTGWSRVGFLREIFPEAYFIHVVRDGRAVANSLLNVEFWEGWRGPDSWRFGPLSDEYEQEWLKYDRSFVVLAGIAWKITMDSALEATSNVPADRVLTVRYEDFCEDPITQFERTADFAGLEFNGRFVRRLEATPVRCRNGKWRTDLSLAQQHELNDILSWHLEKLGYLEAVKGTANSELT